MTRSSIIVIVLLSCFTGLAQKRTSSPYSFFGLGQQTFLGTIENRSMGGIRTLSDSIHVNLRNPASYANLRLTTYTIGGSHTETWEQSATEKTKSNNTNVEYVSIGVPVSKKAAFGIGLIPFKSRGYRISSLTEDIYTNFEGTGNINKAYFGFGIKPFDGLSIGGEVNYNFGKDNNSSSVVLSDVQFGTNEVNETIFSGVSYNFGVHYQTLLNQKYDLQLSATYTPDSKISGENTRTLSAITINSNLEETIVNSTTYDAIKDKYDFPSEISLGIGIGERLKWFTAIEYSLKGSSGAGANSVTPADSQFTDAASYHLGGYYIPNYNSISNFWSRVTYRAGLRYQETGLRLNGEDINEFGISFGMGIPVGQTSAFSNANFGFEYGQRGTTSNGLIKEDFISLSLSLSLNDKWFIKRKYN